MHQRLAPMSPPTYHPERGSSAALWADTPEADKSTRIPAADAMSGARRVTTFPN